MRVGDELTNYLGNYGFNVNHNKDFHDYPAYTGSYTRSKATVEGILQSNPTDIIIDLHNNRPYPSVCQPQSINIIIIYLLHTYAEIVNRFKFFGN